jgi:hypothetical protein
MKFALVLMVGFFLSSCATSQALKVVDPEEKTLPNTSLAITYQFELQEEVMQGDYCQMNMRNLDHGGDYSLPLKVGKGYQNVIAQTVPGRLEVRSIYCYSGLQFLMNDPIKFAARTGKINHGGIFRFTQSEEKGDLSYRWIGMKPEQLKKWGQSLVKEEQERLTSAVDDPRAM